MNIQNNTSRREFIKKSGMGIGGLTIGFSFFHIGGCNSKKEFDTIIKDAFVFDGLGNPSIEMDIGIKNGKISAMGQLSGRSAATLLSASGYALAPGFIDIHSHTDNELLIDPKAQSKIRQGVTTEMVGQDGSSVAPLKEEDRQKQHERSISDYGVPITWTDFNGFYKQLQQGGTAVNWMTMLGQGTLRGYVVGLNDRPATEDEVKEMRRIALECIDQGIWGISSGLEYTPGSFANADEIARVCAVFRERAPLYATHMRNEDDEVEEALQEAITIARSAGTGLQVSHLKAQGQRNWHRADKILQMLEDARNSGMRIAADRYPYEAYSTGLSSLFPLWSREGGTKKFLERLQDEEQFKKIRVDIQNKIDRLGNWQAVMISSVQLEKNLWMLGKRMTEIAQKMGENIFECTRDLIVEEENRVGMCGFGMSEENTKKILKHPLVAIASDGSARSIEGPLSSGHPHPRNFGAFPRILGKYARDEKLFPLKEAIRKMTSFPASMLGIIDRGFLKVGAFADLVIFDPDTVADQATFENPKQYPIGIPYVMVNGEFVIFEGEHTGRLPGRVLVKNRV